MILPPPIKFRRRRGRIKEATKPPTPPPAALTLVSASYDENEAILFLQFSRAVNISGMQFTQITVNDGEFNEMQYVANSASLSNPTTVQITLYPTGSSSVSDLRMTATASTGIVAANDGGTWAGANNLSLPFP